MKTWALGGPGRIEDASQGNRLYDIEEMLKAYTEKGLTEAEALMVLEDDGETCKRVGIQPAGLQEKIYRQRRARVDEMIAAVDRDR